MIDLRSRLPMGVRMIPEQRGALFDLEAWRPGVAQLDGLMRTSIRARGQVEAVPVKRRGFCKPVRDIDAPRFAGHHFQGRPEICAIDADGRRLAIFEESRGPGLGGKT